jgi:hypothetical protein
MKRYFPVSALVHMHRENIEAALKEPARHDRDHQTDIPLVDLKAF